jgi:DNA-binding NarL/FixJ family response regulator
VEDNPVVRRGIHLLLSLEPDLVVCGEAEDAEEAFTQICDLRPDIALVDLTLRESSGLDLIPRVCVECPEVRMLVLSMHDQARWIEVALLAGAAGYLTKDESPDLLVHAIRQVLAGRRYLSDRARARLSEQAGLAWITSLSTQGPEPAGEPPGDRPPPLPGPGLRRPAPRPRG